MIYVAAHWTSFKQKNRGVGSLHYVAYEVLFNQKYTGPEVDIWALGKIISSHDLVAYASFSKGGVLYTMLTGEPPFNAVSDSDVYRKIKKGEWWSNKDKLYSLPVPIINLLQSIFNSNPLKRATMLDIRRQIKQIETLGKARMLPPASATINHSQSLPNLPVDVKDKVKCRYTPVQKIRSQSASGLTLSRLQPILEE